MNQQQQFVVLSLELHLFFARIMKEHALFLEAGFPPPNADCAKEAERYKVEFENLLSRALSLSNGILSKEVLHSGEIVTEFTQGAEQQTQRFTGICIDQQLTATASRLCCGTAPKVTPTLVRQVRQINQDAIRLLNGLIAFKESILNQVLSCRMFTMNYPLLIQHILREARLYRMYIINFQNGRDFDCRSMKQSEQFWNQIMMEHALFLRGLLDPSEKDLIVSSNTFAEEYERLLEQSKERNNIILPQESLKTTRKFRDFKQAGTRGIQECKIRSIILPLLADHVLREANHYIRLLETE